MITPRRSILAAIIETRERQAHQSDVARGYFRAPHAVAGGIGSHKHVNMFVFALEERKLIDRTSRDADRAGARTIEWHPVERRTLFRLLTIPRPISRPDVNRFRRDIEHSTGRSQYRGRIAF